MKRIEEMEDRELLEFIFGAQVQLMRKIDRIERHLQKEVDLKEYLDKNEHQGEVYESMESKAQNFFSQLAEKAAEAKEE